MHYIFTVTLIMIHIIFFIIFENRQFGLQNRQNLYENRQFCLQNRHILYQNRHIEKLKSIYIKNIPINFMTILNFTGGGPPSKKYFLWGSPSWSLKIVIFL